MHLHNQMSQSHQTQQQQQQHQLHQQQQLQQQQQHRSFGMAIGGMVSGGYAQDPAVRMGMGMEVEMADSSMPYHQSQHRKRKTRDDEVASETLYLKKANKTLAATEYAVQHLQLASLVGHYIPNNTRHQQEQEQQQHVYADVPMIHYEQNVSHSYPTSMQPPVEELFQDDLDLELDLCEESLGNCYVGGYEFCSRM